MPRLPSLLVALLALAGPAGAEVELSFYGGWQGAPSGGVTLSGEEVEGSGGGRAGVRATWWGARGLGVGVEASRTDLSWGLADDAPVAEGLGLLTVNGLRRWPDALGPVTPYLGAGLGVALPDARGGDGEAGPALTVTAGASVPLLEGWVVFGEYQGSYVATEVEGEGGSSLDADAFSSGVNLGISFSF